MFGKYKMVYSHLWSTYGQPWQVRLSYVLKLAIIVSKIAALPIASSLIITKISVGNYSGAKQSVIMFVCFSLLIGILTPLVKYIGMLGENKVYRELAISYISKLVMVDLDYFNSNLAGYLTSATRQYIDNSVNLVRGIRDRYLPTILSILLPIFVILWFDIYLGFAIFIMSVVQAIYILWMSHTINPYRTKTREIYKKVSGLMSDIVSNILVVKATAQEKSYIQSVTNGMNKELKLYTIRYMKQIKMIIFREVITVIFFLILLWLTIFRLENGYINVVGATLVVAYTITILTGIYNLSDNLDDHDDYVDKIIPAFDILNRKNEVEDPDSPKEFKKVKGDIEFKNISFAYDSQNGGRLVLDDFSLKISHGEKIGVVGLSGAGKSTLTKLLLRFNKLDQGEIFIDGVNICDVLQGDLRSKISYVSQEPLLFHASIKDNVLVSNLEASANDIIHALGAAHADKFINQLPGGINSVVGERGVKLSGGQKQRIAIARAVLQHAPIMILDEATSALDSESEQIIKDSFKEILRGKTAIVVAHRLSTLSEMDRIIVIDGGKLVEDGSHRELLLNKGLYARLWHRQQKNIETDV
jgi:ATP-binding cassette subfamily B protein